MVKGTPGDPELSNGGLETQESRQTTKKKKHSLKSDGLDSNQRAAQIWRAGKSDGAVNNPPAETPAHNKKHAQGEKVFQRNMFRG